MNVTLYKVSDPAKKLNKSLGTGKNVNVQLKDPTNILNPSLILTKSDMLSYNYMYIPDFSRYYFLKGDDTQNSTIVEVTGNVDALMSHQKEIRGVGAIIERQQNKYNLFLEDAEVPNYAYKRVQTKTFPNSPITVNQQYVLITNGR